MFSHRLIFIVNNIFNIGWLTVQYRLYWTQISYIGLGCASSNIAFFVQYNLYWTVSHPILYNIHNICLYDTKRKFEKKASLLQMFFPFRYKEIMRPPALPDINTQLSHIHFINIDQLNRHCVFGIDKYDILLLIHALNSKHENVWNV